MLKKSNLLLLLTVVLMASCVSRKQLAYFQNVSAESAEAINERMSSLSDPCIKVDDALFISVSALDPEAVIPYNLPNVAYATPTSVDVPTTSSLQYYTVDKDGNINFPVLGKLHVAGMTRSEVISMLEEKLSKQVANPVVSLRFLNARITVLGEVKNPGTYDMKSSRITILEALGMAGDLTQYARRDNILVTRDNNGKLEFARLDLRNDEIFTSPYFYLQQNDVIVVEPNQARSTSNQSISLWLSMVGTVSSAATVVVSVLSITGSLD
jgi:polysaccharide export outer membrane protein